MGIGTTSPGSLLSVHGGNAQITGTSTASGLVATSTLFVGSTGNLFNVLQSGFVGIGTTSPSSLLSIHGNTLVSATTTTGSLIATSTLFVGSNGNLLNVLQSGFIGIGTTSPSSLLSVQGIANFVPNATSTLYTTLSLPNLYSTSTTATSTFAGSLYVASSTPTQNALFAVGTSSPLLFIDKNTGSVGIATTSSPAQNFLFAVHGTSSPSIFVDRNSGKIGIGSSSPSARLSINGFGTGTDRGLVFADSSNTERLTVLDNGNVGIGTTSPIENLAVKGNASVSDKLIIGGSGATVNYPFEISSNVNNRVIQIQNSPTGGNQNTYFRFQVDVSTAANNIGYADGSWSGGGADVAEWYPTSYRQELEPGDLVSIDTVQKTVGTTTIKSLVKKTVTNEDKKNILGVISTAPGLVVGSGDFEEDDASRNAHEVQVALAGRVPVKVTTESGPIKIGDRITSSSLPGVGMKATKDGYTVGIALESFDGENATTTAEVQGSSSTSSESKIVKTGKILVFVNLGYSKLDDGIASAAQGSPSTSSGTNSGGFSTGSNNNLWTIDQQTGKVTASFTAGLDLNGNSLENVRAILSSNGTWSIDERGKLVVKEVEAEQVTTKRLQLKDEATGELYCVKIVNSEWQKTKGACQ